MKSNSVIKDIGDSMSEIGFKLRKSSPEILIVAGVLGIVASTIMACKATTKLGDVIDGAKESIDDIHDKTKEIVESRTDTDLDEIKKAEGKEIASVWVHTGVDLVKLFGPAIGLEAISIASVVASHKIIKKRNIGLAAAVTALSKEISGRSKRTIEKFGEDAEKEIKYGIHKEEYEEESVDENGNSLMEKKVRNVIKYDTDLGPYTYIFGAQTSSKFQNNDVFDTLFLKSAEEYFDHLLKSKYKHHIFINDILNYIGIKETVSGHDIGWIYDEANPIGDNCIKFNITKASVMPEGEEDFFERVYVIEFNADGNIIENAF